MATVMCAKYNEELPALPRQPFPGKDGVVIFEQISAKAWDEWLNIQTMLINEERLNMMNTDARKYLTEQRNRFLFTDEELDMPTMPTDYNDPRVPKFF
jgi:Fe-S cluster biosynthesis and repair protein YggX